MSTKLNEVYKVIVPWYESGALKVRLVSPDSFW